MESLFCTDSRDCGHGFCQTKYYWVSYCECDPGFTGQWCHLRYDYYEEHDVSLDVHPEACCRLLDVSAFAAAAFLGIAAGLFAYAKVKLRRNNAASKGTPGERRDSRENLIASAKIV